MSSIETEKPIAGFSEQGEIPVNHLKRFWSKSLAKRYGAKDLWSEENQLDLTLLSCLGLALEPTIQYVYQFAPTFQEFEDWIKTQSDPNERLSTIERFNLLFESDPERMESQNQLPEEDSRFFDENGYLIIREAISKQDCEETVALITSHLGIDLNNPETWYVHHPSQQGIMVQLFKHPILEQNRQSRRIREVFECLWKNSNLWVTTDRVGFNPPETSSWTFPGPHLHLDIEPQIPLPFGLQGILYLTDTEENQGAFTLVPGFHQKINQWMSQFRPGDIPLSGVFNDLQKKPIAAKAGDFIIWHHGLPHGSSPNTHTKPRIVQYIKWYPVEVRG